MSKVYHVFIGEEIVEESSRLSNDTQHLRNHDGFSRGFPSRAESCLECKEGNYKLAYLVPDNYHPLSFLRKICRKVGKADSQIIYCYYEFGLALTIRLNELIKKWQKKMRKKLNDEVHKHFPPGTTLATVRIK
ncbi:16457_t:CDS:2 [Funneliformis geosporum]|uniref:16457_t:CDS:1 n=1 Tax=Funneliformis geosporum TaxID=1117311 RepID=A0A9W4T6S8_9GLOM|nr:16457_t:CDS:2 [Funneliformis geosporum]